MQPNLNQNSGYNQQRNIKENATQTVTVTLNHFNPAARKW